MIFLIQHPILSPTTITEILNFTNSFSPEGGRHEILQILSTPTEGDMEFYEFCLLGKSLVAYCIPRTRSSNNYKCCQEPGLCQTTLHCKTGVLPVKVINMKTNLNIICNSQDVKLSLHIRST